MSLWSYVKPEAAGFDGVRLQRVFDVLKEWTATDKVPAAALCVGRKGGIIEPQFFGRMRAAKDSPEIRKDALFLIASITKPVTVTAVMMLVERGLLTLDDRVTRFVPRFEARGKDEVRIRHLMTHTSGLPDQLPDNFKLRRAHKPFSAFIDAVCNQELLYPPGTNVGYQSMGTAMLAEVLHQISGQTLPEFLRKEVFEPLKMNDTALGLKQGTRERIADVRLPKDMENTDWHWNTDYWLGFGAPWGGLITSPADFARFCLMMLNNGALDGVRILSPATVRTMTMNQLQMMPDIPEMHRRCQPWGLGWRLNWPGHSANFGDLLGPRTYGHWGATGTVCWIDPETQTFCILFTTQPQEPDGRFLARLCNMVAAAAL